MSSYAPNRNEQSNELLSDSDEVISAHPSENPETSLRISPRVSLNRRQHSRSRSDLGLTVSDVARRYRVGEDKVRNWIRNGELLAINTAAALCGKPRWVVSAEALAEFERRRSSAPPAKPPKRRRGNAIKDYYP
jgi:hypothetical protein